MSITFSRDFDRNLDINHGVGPDLTFSRTDYATYFGFGGKHAFAPHNVLPRSDLHGNWSTVSASVVEDATTGPDGSPADKVVATAASSTHRIRFDISTLYEVDTDYIWTAVMKSNGYPRVLVDPEVLTGNEGATFDLDAVSVVSDASTGGATIVDLGDGWVRCQIKFNSDNAAQTTHRFTYYVVNSAGDSNFEADGVSGFFVQHSQLNVGSALTPYVNTPGAATVQEARTGSYFYDGAAWVNRGLLIEKGATSLIVSQDYSDASFVYTRTTKTANTEIRNGLFGQEVVDDEGANNTHRISVVINLTDTVQYCYSWIARNGALTPWCYFDTTAVAAGHTYFGIDSKTLGATPDHDAEGLIDLGNGLTLCWVAFTVSTGTGSKSMSVNMSEADEDNAHPGDGNHLLWLYGAMIEVGAFPSSRTLGLATTNAESITAALAPGADTTIYVEGFTGFDAGVVLQIDDGTENERFRIERDASNDMIVTVTDGSVEQAAIDAGNVADHTAFRLAIRFSDGDFSASLDGAAVVVDALGTIPTMTTIRIGHDTAAGEEFNGYIGKVRVLDTGLTDAELIQLALTGPSEVQSQRISLGMGVGI